MFPFGFPFIVHHQRNVLLEALSPSSGWRTWHKAGPMEGKPDVPVTPNWIQNHVLQSPVLTQFHQKGAFTRQDFYRLSVYHDYSPQSTSQRVDLNQSVGNNLVSAGFFKQTLCSACCISSTAHQTRGPTGSAGRRRRKLLSPELSGLFISSEL